MFQLQWALFGLLLWPLVSTVGDTRSHGAGRKMSTLLSFDLRRKTKHHHERNVTISPTTPAPATNNAEEEEEVEFSLRVCVIRLRTRNLDQISLFMRHKRKACGYYICIFHSMLFFCDRVLRTLMLLSWILAHLHKG